MSIFLRVTGLPRLHSQLCLNLCLPKLDVPRTLSRSLSKKLEISTTKQVRFASPLLMSFKFLLDDAVNIYSHLFGALLFFTLPIPVYNALSPRYASASKADIIVFSTFFFGVAICFLLSSTFHIVSNHSPGVRNFGNQLDYLGIVILMWGSTIPCVYYGFYCDPKLQKIYWSMVCIHPNHLFVAGLGGQCSST